MATMTSLSRSLPSTTAGEPGVTEVTVTPAAPSGTRSLGLTPRKP